MGRAPQNALRLGDESFKCLGGRRRRRDFVVAKAVDGMAGANRLGWRHLAPAAINHERATRSEKTPSRQINGARDLALEADRAFHHEIGVRQQDGGKQSTRIGMLRLAEESY